MSASESDYSIDWLASDEEEYDSAVGLSPDHPDGPQTSLPQTPSPSSFSSSSSSRDSPTTPHIHSARIGSTTNCDSGNKNSVLKRDRDNGDESSCDTQTNSEAPWATETQRDAFVDQRQSQSWAFWTTSPNRVDSALSMKRQQRQHQTRRRAHSPGSPGHRDEPTFEGTEEDRLFAHKCWELQCYIQPLTSILHGLQSGRYSERLSSFQESVAIDRIQRIKGVLQNPDMGERYISIILKMEEMLHSWFPHVKAHHDHVTDGPEDHNNTSAKRQKQYHGTPHPPPLGPPTPSEGEVGPRTRSNPLPGFYTTTHLKWFHTPICSSKMGTQTQGRPSTCLLSTCSDPAGATQDDAVSSSTDSHTDTHPPTRPRRVPLFKISSPCLERLLKAKESIIVPRNIGGGRNELW